MEDYEAQEIEFWAKLEEEGMSRSSMLRRSAAAAFGLTIVGGASTALGATKAALSSPPTRMTKAGLPALIKAAKKEGHLNTIALPPGGAMRRRNGTAAAVPRYVTSRVPAESAASCTKVPESARGSASAPRRVMPTHGVRHLWCKRASAEGSAPPAEIA